MELTSYTAPSPLSFFGSRPDKPVDGDAYIDQISGELFVHSGGRWVGLKGYKGDEFDSKFVYAPYIPLFTARPPEAGADGPKDFEEV